MTIENAEAYVRNLWNWSIFDGCFGKTRIRMTDIDGAVERNGFALEIETKEPGVIVSPKDGQYIRFDRLRRNGYFTGILVWGHPQIPEHAQFFRRQEVTPIVPCDLNTLRENVSRWFKMADAATVPDPTIHTCPNCGKQLPLFLAAKHARHCTPAGVFAALIAHIHDEVTTSGTRMNDDHAKQLY